MNGMYPQVDSQIIYLHILCGVMAIFLSGMLITNKYQTEVFNHPLIYLPFLLALNGIVSSILGRNFNFSLSGAPQIGQGVFWYFDIVIMTIIFSQILHLKKIRVILFINITIITFIVSFFTFFPYWQGVQISFYYFTDYLCFYGVLNFILLTTITKNRFIVLLAFILLGFYFFYLENRAAMLFWVTSSLMSSVYLILKFLKNYYRLNKVIKFLFSPSMFIFIIFFISFLILFSSLYFWSSQYNLSISITDTILDGPVVRGKILENSLKSIDSFGSFLFGHGWGVIPDLLLENMNTWQYDALRLGYNLHFHTHNELVEHLVSLGLVGGLLYLLYIYNIFKVAKHLSFKSMLGWLLFFKITCFWFLWIGTITLYVAVLSCFIIVKTNILDNSNKVKIWKNYTLSIVFLCSGIFLFYGAIMTLNSVKIKEKLSYEKIVAGFEKEGNSVNKCLEFYNDYDRGGFILDRFLHNYSSYIFKLEKNKIDNKEYKVLLELQCKANAIIKNNSFTSSLLNTSMQVDTQFYYKFGNTKKGISYIEQYYNDWFRKALIMSKVMPNRVDLIMPFLSYAITNEKSKDAAKVCSVSRKNASGICDLVSSYEILNRSNINQEDIQESIKFIESAIEKGIFNELAYGFWANENFKNHGLRGIPLAPNILFLIPEDEKQSLERVIKANFE